MDVTPTQTTTPPPLFSGQNSQDEQTTAAKTTLSSDFETFLKMLTVQMENQDPLNPIDSTDYAVQLATFSSVEQQVLTNDLLSALSTSMSGGGLGTLGQWVGMEVRGSSKAQFSGNPVDVTVPTFEGADRRLLVVANEQGQTVARVVIDLTSPDYSWNGQLATGTSAGNGTYSFRVEGYEAGQLIGSEPAQTYARVQEARIEDSGAVLLLEGGSTLKSTDVTALREPASVSGQQQFP